MKPNPVKKTVEYCSIGGGHHCLHEVYNAKKGSVLCNKHCRTLRGGVLRFPLMDIDIERPSWCTDETFVRVKVEPFIHNNTEYCRFMDGYSIGESNGRCNLLPLGGTYCPCLRAHIAFDPGMTAERPEACRKLEV